MTVEERIASTLVALAGGRVYPDFAPPGAAAPYIVFQQVGGQGFNHTEGTLPTAENCRMQLSVWCETRIEATTLAQQAEALLLQAITFQATTLGSRTSLVDEDTGLRGARQDFSVWVPRT
jgi:hypothetical protein